jgi:hypothetical protein
VRLGPPGRDDHRRDDRLDGEQAPAPVRAGRRRPGRRSTASAVRRRCRPGARSPCGTGRGRDRSPHQSGPCRAAHRRGWRGRGPTRAHRRAQDGALRDTRVSR